MLGHVYIFMYIHLILRRFILLTKKKQRTLGLHWKLFLSFQNLKIKHKYKKIIFYDLSMILAVW